MAPGNSVSPAPPEGSSVDVRSKLQGFMNHQLLSPEAKRKIALLLESTDGSNVPKVVIQTVATAYSTIENALQDNIVNEKEQRTIIQSLTVALQKVRSGASLEDTMKTFSGKFEKFGDVCKKVMEVLENTLRNCTPETLDFLRKFFGGGTFGALIDMVRSSERFRSFYIIGVVEGMEGRVLEGIPSLSEMRKQQPTFDDSQLNSMRSEKVLAVCKPMLQPLRSQAEQIAAHPGRTGYDFEQHVAAILTLENFPANLPIKQEEIVSKGKNMLKDEIKSNPIQHSTVAAAPASTPAPSATPAVTASPATTPAAASPSTP